MQRKPPLEEPHIHAEWLQIEADPEPEYPRRRDYWFGALAIAGLLLILATATAVFVTALAREFGL